MYMTKIETPQGVPSKSEQAIDKMIKFLRKIVGEPQKDDRELPTPSLHISIETLLEIEKWADKARTGDTKYAFSPISDSVKYNGEKLNDAVKALTLAQIMPYTKMVKSVRRYRAVPKGDKYYYVEWLADKYSTSIQNVIDRMEHVRILSLYNSERRTEREEEN